MAAQFRGLSQQATRFVVEQIGIFQCANGVSIDAAHIEVEQS